MKIKLSTFDTIYVPDVIFKLEDGTTKNNRELEESCQVRCEITMANISQKSKYINAEFFEDNDKQIKKSNFIYNSCIETHVIKITGLEEFGIKNGKDLIAHAPLTELNDLILDLFFKINGVKLEDNISEKK